MRYDEQQRIAALGLLGYDGIDGCACLLSECLCTFMHCSSADDLQDSANKSDDDTEETNVGSQSSSSKTVRMQPDARWTFTLGSVYFSCFLGKCIS